MLFIGEILVMSKVEESTLIKPLVTVIVPFYNRKSVLHKAINSVLNQCYETFELLLIDDGSEDGAANLVNCYDDERADKKIMEKVCEDYSVPLEDFYKHFSMTEVEHTMRVVLCKVAKIDELQGMCLPYIIK